MDRINSDLKGGKVGQRNKGTAYPPGIIEFEKAHGVTPESIHKQTSGNLEAPILLDEVAIKKIKDQDQGGQTINISSVSAQIDTSKLTFYSTTEGGLIQCTRCIAAEYALKKGIPLCDFSEDGGNRRARFLARFRSRGQHDRNSGFPQQRHELII